MALIESVAVRQRGGYDFATHYDNLCALHNTCPIPAVKAHLAQRVLDINADRVRATDWLPILNTLKINKTLEFIAVRSFFQLRIEDAEEQGYSIKRKIPSIRSKEITYRLCRALRDCLCVNQVLTSIELQGVPLRERDVTTLSKGIAKSGCLKHLSVEYCIIGDELVDILCHVVKNAISVTSLNFTGCGLSSKSAGVLAEVIKHQAMLRHNEAWKDSLRYRKPELDRMSGLRRLTLNCNPMIGDQGAQLLADVLKDDLWVKAIDLQKCGISNVGAKALLDILKYNTTLIVVDIRQNPLVESETMKSIVDQVVINTGGQPSEYQWVKAEPPEDPAMSKQRKKRTKTILNNFGRKMTVKISGTPTRRRPSSDQQTSAGRSQVKPSPGIPWRAAQRATRCRGYPPDNSCSPGSFLDSTTATGDHSMFHLHRSADGPGSMQHTSTDGDRQLAEYHVTGDSKSEMEQLRKHVAAESAARLLAENRVTQLTLENIRLRKELDDLQAQRSLLDDESVINQIEQSFQQFNSFLDLLRDKGLGQLVAMAGLNMDAMKIFSNGEQQHANHRQSTGHRHSSSVLEHSSRLDDSVLSDIPAMRSASQSFIDPTMLGSPRSGPHSKSKFDELYQKAMQNTEQILAGTGSLSAHENQLSNAPSEKSSRSVSERVTSQNLANSDRSRVVSGKSDPLDKSADLAAGRPQPKPRTAAGQSDLNKSADSDYSRGSLHSDRSAPRYEYRQSRDTQQHNGSNFEGSDEYTTDDDEIDEIHTGTNSR